MKGLLVFSLLLIAGSSAFASTITWATNMFPAAPGVVDLGATSKLIADDTHSFNLFANSLNITNMPDVAVLGASINPTYTTTVDLGGENDGAGLEHGLGIRTSTDAEMRNGYALQINLSGFAYTSVSLTIDSIDPPNEGFRIWGTSTTKPMVLLAQSSYSTGGFVQTETFDNTYSIFEITSDTPHNGIDSVVLRSVSINTIPEPTTLVMMGLGLALVTLLARRGWYRP
jgi:hypothetical protein